VSFFGSVIGSFAGSKAAVEDDGADLGGQLEEAIGEVYDPSEEFR
jgi:hypothetical protein